MTTRPFTFAYQPIVDMTDRTVYAYEALIRGTRNESAADILGSVSDTALYRLDEAARAGAVQLASKLGLSCSLSLNFMPESLAASEQTLDNTLSAAARCGFPLERLILEATEGQMLTDTPRWSAAINRCRAHGVRVAIDDFGAGYSGLNLLADFQPDLLKIDMNLVRDIQSSGPRQAIVRGILQTCADLGIDVIAEGIESAPELHWFRRQNVELFQGYLFSKPGFESLPGARFLNVRTEASSAAAMPINEDDLPMPSDAPARTAAGSI